MLQKCTRGTGVAKMHQGVVVILMLHVRSNVGGMGVASSIVLLTKNFLVEILGFTSVASRAFSNAT